MALSSEEMLADLRKVRIRTYFYLGAAIVLAVLTVALVVSFFVRVPHDLAAIFLAVAAGVFTGIMVNQTVRTRRLVDVISRRIATCGGGDEQAGEDSDESPGTPEAPDTLPSPDVGTAGAPAEGDGEPEGGGQDEP